MTPPGSSAARPRPRRCSPGSTGKPFRGPEFARDEETVELYWRVREGLHGLVGRLRPPGTALIVEDVCVPPGPDRRGGRGDPGAARPSTGS